MRASPLTLAASENFSRIDRLSNLRPLPLVAVREPVLFHEPKSAPVDSGCSWLFGSWDNCRSAGMNGNGLSPRSDNGHLLSPRSGELNRRQTEPWTPMSHSSTPGSRGLTPESSGLSSSNEEFRPGRNAGIDSMSLPSINQSKKKIRPSKSMLFLVSDDKETEWYMKRCCSHGRSGRCSPGSPSSHFTQSRLRAASAGVLASVRMRSKA